MRIVADTNIVLSGLLWRGTPHRLLTEIGHSSSIVLVSSAPLLEELAAVLIRPKYSGRLGLIG